MHPSIASNTVRIIHGTGLETDNAIVLSAFARKYVTVAIVARVNPS